MAKNYNFDYLVIGSGPAGRTAAIELARGKKHVGLVECADLGGAEINTRDLPYKLGLDFAHTYQRMISSPAVSPNSCHFNFPTLISSYDEKLNAAQDTIIAELNALGITLIYGYAHFLDPHTIAVDEKKYTAREFILATGSELKATEISGLDGVAYLTPDNALRPRKLPRFVFVVGGGPTGVQIADYYASLGTGVIIMERGPHLLPREDEDIASALSQHLSEDLGVTIVTGSRVTAITEDYNSKIVVFMNGTSEKMVRVDCIALATGSEPLLDYGLENAGVEYKRTGIVADKYGATSCKNIYAVGDCVSSEDSSTARAVHEGRVLAGNLLHRQKTVLKPSQVIRTVGTSPAIATIGLNERDATARDLKYQKTITYLKDVPSLPFTDESDGFIKVLSDRSGRFLGATSVGPEMGLAFYLKKVLTK